MMLFESGYIYSDTSSTFAVHVSDVLKRHPAVSETMIIPGPPDLRRLKTRPPVWGRDDGNHILLVFLIIIPPDMISFSGC
jgi:hypothetical protein